MDSDSRFEASATVSDGRFELELATGRFLASPGCCAMLAYSPEDLPPTIDAWTDLLHPQDRAAALVVLGEYKHERQSHALELRLRAKTGEWRWILSRGHVVARDAAGQAERIAGMHLDITGWKGVAEALRESEATFRGLFEALPEGIAVQEMLFAESAPRDYRLVAANRVYLRCLGLPRDAVGRCATEIFGVSPPPHLDLFDRVAGGEEPASYEIAGTPAHPPLSVSVFSLGHGRFATLVVDTSLRHQAEDAFWQCIRQLERLLAVAQELPGRQHLPGFPSLIARRAAELVEAPTATLFAWDETAQLLRTVAWHGSGPWRAGGVFRLGEGIPGAVAERRTALLCTDLRRSPDAHPFYLKQTSATAVVAAPLLCDGRLMGVLACDNEDGERVFTPADQDLLMHFALLAARTLVSAQEFEQRGEAQQALVQQETQRALGDMANGIAHDLNNRFAAIQGYLELVKLKGATPQGLAKLESAVTEAVQVVHRFQMFARQRPEASLTPLDLRPIVQDAVQSARARWQAEHPDRPQALEVQVALDGLPPILGDPPQVREVLASVLGNAVDALAQGGTLTVAGSATDEAAVLQIFDSGIGMSEDIRQKAFEPFFTTKAGRGSGLGLSIVYGIMQRHGGGAELASTPGRGTTVTLRFRRAAEAAPPSPTMQPHETWLLVVADDPHARRILAGLLRSAGHMVAEAQSGEAALATLAAYSIDVVLAEAHLPQMTGWDLAQAIKARQPQLPVVLLTDRDASPVARSMFVDRVLGKPTRLEPLLQTIQALMAKRGGRRGE
jgi:signal transduction histidine kinase/CheY-like chemotaxis protein/PAS domain-containing protein